MTSPVKVKKTRPSASSFKTIPTRTVLSHIDALNYSHILYSCRTFHPKGAREGSSLEVLVERFDSPLLHGSLLITDIIKIGARRLVCLPLLWSPFPEPTQLSLKLWTTTSPTDHPANTSN